MSDHDATAAHGTGHDDHGHDTATLGPIDWKMWLVGVVGVVAGLIVVAGIALSTSFAFNA